MLLVQLSCVKCDLEEMDFILSMRENNLVEQLLPSKHSFFIRELRSQTLSYFYRVYMTLFYLFYFLIKIFFPSIHIRWLMFKKYISLVNFLRKYWNNNAHLQFFCSYIPATECCRSGVKHTNVLLRREVFRTFTINFFTYGFPVYISNQSVFYGPAYSYVCFSFMDVLISY